jgi:hypothetical protein
MDEIYLQHTCNTSDSVLKDHSPVDPSWGLGSLITVNSDSTTPSSSGQMLMEEQPSWNDFLGEFGSIQLSMSGVIDMQRFASQPWYEQSDSTSSLGFENQVNNARLRRLRSDFTRDLLAHVLDGEFEYGFESAGDAFVRQRLRENALATKEWINEIFLAHFHDERVVAGILRIIAHLEYEEIEPQGPTMAIAALSHESAVVQECGVRAFENWEFPGCVEYLKSLSCGEDWLQQYIETVIAGLEELTRNEVGQEN